MVWQLGSASSVLRYPWQFLGLVQHQSQQQQHLHYVISVLFAVATTGLLMTGHWWPYMQMRAQERRCPRRDTLQLPPSLHHYQQVYFN